MKRALRIFNGNTTVSTTITGVDYIVRRVVNA